MPPYFPGCLPIFALGTSDFMRLVQYHEGKRFHLPPRGNIFMALDPTTMIQETCGHDELFLV